MFISLPFGTSSTFLLGLLSAVLIVVAIRHLATKSWIYFACFYFYFAVFSCRGYCRLAAIVFAVGVAVPFFASLRPSSCHFHHCHLFYRSSASNIAAFHSRLDLELPFLLWSCCCHIHFAAEDVFVVTSGCCPVFFLLFWLSFFSSFSPSYCSYVCRHC